MSYTTWVFAIFLILTLIVYYIVPKKGRPFVLLGASCVFYMIYSSVLILAIAFTTVTVYLSALAISRVNRSGAKNYKRNKKLILALFAAVNLIILVLFKYTVFFADLSGSVLGLFMGNLTIPHIDLAIPLGISFYTLQAISYLADVYRGREADRSFGRTALYLIFFPQLTAGPIGRYDLAYSLYTGHSFDYTRFTYACRFLLWGLFKKMVLADRIAIFTDSYFNHLSSAGGIGTLVCIAFYTLQIYCDLSGCVDIARAISLMLGINLAENYKRPFLALTVKDFWHRFNITLTGFMRDYVFYPLSLKFNFKNRYMLLVPFLITSVLTGIWYGAGSTFIIFGLYFFVLIALGMLIKPLTDKLLITLHINTKALWYKIFCIIRTLFFVSIGLILLRTKNLDTLNTFFASLFNGDFSGQLTSGKLFSGYGIYKGDFLVVAISAVILFVVEGIKEKGVCISEKIAKKNIAVRFIIYYASIFFVLLFGAYGSGYRLAELIYALI